VSTIRGLLAAFALLALIAALPSAEAGAQLDVSGSGYHEQESFASANGTAMFTMTIANSGDEGYSAVQVSAETDDPEWPADLVNFTIRQLYHPVHRQLQSGNDGPRHARRRR